MRPVVVIVQWLVLACVELQSDYKCFVSILMYQCLQGNSSMPGIRVSLKRQGQDPFSFTFGSNLLLTRMLNFCTVRPLL